VVVNLRTSETANVDATATAGKEENNKDEDNLLPPRDAKITRRDAPDYIQKVSQRPGGIHVEVHAAAGIVVINRRPFWQKSTLTRPK